MLNSVCKKATVSITVFIRLYTKLNKQKSCQACQEIKSNEKNNQGAKKMMAMDPEVIQIPDPDAVSESKLYNSSKSPTELIPGLKLP